MRRIFLMTLILSFTSCNFEKKHEALTEKKWIYIEIGQDTDAKYGEISLEHLDLINKVPKIRLLLYTSGGDTMAA